MNKGGLSTADNDGRAEARVRWRHAEGPGDGGRLGGGRLYIAEARPGGSDEVSGRATVRQCRSAGCEAFAQAGVGERQASAGRLSRSISPTRHDANTHIILPSDHPSTRILSNPSFAFPHHAEDKAQAVFGLEHFVRPPASPPLPLTLPGPLRQRSVRTRPFAYRDLTCRACQPPR